MAQFKAEKHRFATATEIEHAQLLIQEGCEDVAETAGANCSESESKQTFPAYFLLMK